MIMSRKNHIMESDIKETKDSYVLEMNLPGFQKEDIKAYVENDFLIVSAEQNEESKKKRHLGRYIRCERFTGLFRREFYIGSDISGDNIKAVYKHGVLKVTIPKAGAGEIANHPEITIS